jgi:hypothetical protein
MGCSVSLISDVGPRVVSLTKRGHENEEKENAIAKIFIGLEPAG